LADALKREKGWRGAEWPSSARDGSSSPTGRMKRKRGPEATFDKADDERICLEVEKFGLGPKQFATAHKQNYGEIRSAMRRVSRRRAVSAETRVKAL